MLIRSCKLEFYPKGDTSAKNSQGLLIRVQRTGMLQSQSQIILGSLQFPVIVIHCSPLSDQSSLLLSGERRGDAMDLRCIWDRTDCTVKSFLKTKISKVIRQHLKSHGSVFMLCWKYLPVVLPQYLENALILISLEATQISQVTHIWLTIKELLLLLG